MALFDDDRPRAPRAGGDWDQHRRHRQPFAGPPHDEVGVATGTSFEVARGEEVVVAVRGITAYSDGLALHVVVLFADEQPAQVLDADLPEWTRNPGRFRFGVVLADGGRATTGDREAPGVVRPAQRATLTQQWSRTTVLQWEAVLWLWPLPPPGPLVVGCRWPDRGIPETLVQVEAEPLRAAAAGSATVWGLR